MNKNTVITYESAGRKITLSCQHDSPVWATEVKGISGNTAQISESQGAAQIGSTVSNISVQPKEITVNGAVLRDLEANRRGILACVYPGSTGRLTVTQDGESWYIDGTPRTSPDFSDGLAVQQFQFSLYCPYPYFHSTKSGSTVVAGLEKQFRFPCNLAGAWRLSRYTDSLFATVRNAGASPMEFDVIFTAATAVENPELYHVDKGSYIRLNRVMAAREVITVSTVYGRKGATVRHPDGTQENAFRYLTVGSDLNMTMAPGANTVRGGADSNREGLRIQIIMPKGVVPGL